MAGKITLDITSNIDLVARAFQLAPVDTVKSINSAISLMAIKLEQSAKPKVPVDTGALRADVKVQEMRNLYAKVGTLKQYGLYVHEGTKPHFPPVSALTGWAKRHGVSPFAVARGISRKGTKARPFLTEALNETESFRVKSVTDAMQTVINNIVNNAK